MSGKWGKYYYARIKNQIFDAYGRECKCCGETIERFLTLDHINNDGFKDKKRGYGFYIKVRKMGYPNTLQILCFNCNCGRALNKGVCPHLRTAD